MSGAYSLSFVFFDVFLASFSPVPASPASMASLGFLSTIRPDLQVVLWYAGTVYQSICGNPTICHLCNKSYQVLNPNQALVFKKWDLRE